MNGVKVETNMKDIGILKEKNMDLENKDIQREKSMLEIG